MPNSKSTTKNPPETSAMSVLARLMYGASTVAVVWGGLGAFGVVAPPFSATLEVTMLVATGIFLAGAGFDFLGGRIGTSSDTPGAHIRAAIQATPRAAAATTIPGSVPSGSNPVAASPAAPSIATAPVTPAMRRAVEIVTAQARAAEEAAITHATEAAVWPLVDPPAAEEWRSSLKPRTITFDDFESMPSLLVASLRTHVNRVPVMSEDHAFRERGRDRYYVRNDGPRYDVRLLDATI